MNETEHLLQILSEECAEVAVRVSKANRFGLSEVEPGQEFTNAERIMHEYIDLFATIEMCWQRGIVPQLSPDERFQRKQAKRAKVGKFMAYAVECGTLEATS